MDLPSTKPYLLRALWEWCCDNGFTPYLSVVVDEHTRVPGNSYVTGRSSSTSARRHPGLQIGNELIEFPARFGGIARDLSVPVDQVAAIYARKTGPEWPLKSAPRAR